LVPDIFMTVNGETSDGPASPEPEPEGEEATASSTPAAILRQAVLEHLVEYWYSQDETLRLAKQWTRYEKVSSDARAAALAAFDSEEGGFGDQIEAAMAAIDGVKNVTGEQKAYALSAVLRSSRFSPHPDNGYAMAALASVRKRRKDMGLLAAQLLTLVADFELFVLRVSTAWLAFDASHLSEKSRTLTFKELETFGSIDEIREPIVHDFLEDLMRKSASGWFDEFSKMFGGVKIQGAKDFATLEVFQRRHVFVHHGGIVSRQYLEALKNFKMTVALGDELSVDLDYVERAAASLASAAHSVVMCALITSSATDATERREAEREAGELTYILLTLQRDVVVDRFVSAFDLTRVKDTFARELLRVNGWIAKRRLGRLGDVVDEIAEWDTEASDDRFKLAKLILLDKKQMAVDKAVKMIAQGRLSEYAVAMWPLFETISTAVFEEIERESSGVVASVDQAKPPAAIDAPADSASETGEDASR
jgi:hypothetical protein